MIPGYERATLQNKAVHKQGCTKVHQCETEKQGCTRDITAQEYLKSLTVNSIYIAAESQLF